MLSVDGVIPGRENAVAPLDVRLLQREHGFAQREASVHVVRHYAIEKGKRGNALMAMNPMQSESTSKITVPMSAKRYASMPYVLL